MWQYGGAGEGNSRPYPRGREGWSVPTQVPGGLDDLLRCGAAGLAGVGAVAVDVDAGRAATPRTGILDLFVANDIVRNFLYGPARKAISFRVAC